MEVLIESIGAVSAIVAALAIFAGAWWLVARARAGNRKVREARHDPHAVRDEKRTQDPNRDIRQ